MQQKLLPVASDNGDSLQPAGQKLFPIAIGHGCGSGGLAVRGYG